MARAARQRPPYRTLGDLGRAAATRRTSTACSLIAMGFVSFRPLRASYKALLPSACGTVTNSHILAPSTDSSGYNGANDRRILFEVSRSTGQYYRLLGTACRKEPEDPPSETCPYSTRARQFTPASSNANR